MNFKVLRSIIQTCNEEGFEASLNQKRCGLQQEGPINQSKVTLEQSPTSIDPEILIELKPETETEARIESMEIVTRHSSSVIPHRRFGLFMPTFSLTNPQTTR